MKVSRIAGISFFVLLLIAGEVVAQSKHRSAGINLSLWKNIATQRTDSTGSTWLNVGVCSSMNRLNGWGANVLGATVGREMNGVQVGGIFNRVGGSMHGIQIAGITNINGDNLSGISLSGLVGITGNRARGVIMSGLANITGDRSSGLVIGGLLNLTGGESAGVQAGGLANISGGDHRGLAIGGLLGVAGENLRGIQLAGLGNIVAQEMKGIQIAGIGNVAGGALHGMQLAPFNVAIRAKGLQIGLVNYYKESLEGFQLGLVNANPQTRVQLMLFGGNSTKLNIAARFKNERYYTLLGIGTHYFDFSDKFSASAFYRAGVAFPLGKRFSISGDMGYQHIETCKNKDYGLPARLYSLQLRANLEYRPVDCFGLFATGGYGWDRYYDRNACFDKGTIVEGGVVLFR